MTIKSYKEQERQKYIAENNLQDSYLDTNILYQCRKVLPIRKQVGVTESGDKIFYEETKTSLVNRNYGYRNEVVGWNLVYYNGEKTQLVTKDYIATEGNSICFYEGYSLDSIKHYLANKKKRDALSGSPYKKKRYTFWVYPQEIELVKEFLKRLRKENEKINV